MAGYLQMNKKKIQMKTIDVIFWNVANGEGGHGSFLTNFAITWAYADMYNKVLLFDVANEIIEKYNLNQKTYKIIKKNTNL